MASPFSDTQLKKFKKSLRETSADYSRGARIEFVSFDDTVYDFDGVTKEVCAKYRYDPCSSCDALYLNNGKYYLIEFKNQGESNIKKDEIKKKALIP